MKSRLFFFAIFALSTTNMPSAADRPNIIVIMADDMGYECVRSNGGESYVTPHLDKLAAGGMRFENAHSQPICTPTRVQIMSGIYNNRNYVRFGVLDPQIKTFGNLMKSAGYRTCIVGKWQLDGGFEGPAHFGFDEYCLWQLTRRPGRYSNPGLEVNGQQVDYTNGEYGPEIVSDYLCDFIRRNRNEEFFAWYPMILPHYPFVPTPDSADYDPTVVGEKGIGKAKYFPDMVAYVDRIIGKVIATLDETGLRNNTLVIFTGDNGTHPKITSILNGQSYQGGKGSTNDNGTHVPMIASWPGVIPEGTVTKALVDFTDFLPTIAEVGETTVSTDWKIQGQSFLPTLRTPTQHSRSVIYCWYHRDGVREKAEQLVRTERYKLYSDGRFYDLLHDFAQKSPLSDSDITGEAAVAKSTLEAALQTHTAITKQADPIQNKRREALARGRKTIAP